MARTIKVKKETIFYAALYMRLSREDGDKEESDSIANQRRMLTGYIEKQKDFSINAEYVDDGYSGTNFHRPGFIKMVEDIEAGKVNCVIVKDLSRFGRDYINSGYYLERYFVDNEIRFIALNDNIDSLVCDYDMLVPVKNVFNSQYARDISRKVQSSFKVKQQSGEFIGAFPSYGYGKAPLDRHQLIIDEYAASIVKRIFHLYLQGNGKIKIAHILNAEGILCPSAYKKVCGYNYSNGNRLESTSYWTYPTIHRMLSNEMYIGNMVQGKTKRRMKGKAKLLSQEQWIVVEGTHEPIIDKEIWDKVQRLLQKETKQLNFNENISVFAGFIKCGDCGRVLSKKYNYKERSEQGKQRSTYYVCSGYTRYGKQACTAHKIQYDELEQVLLEDLRIIINSIESLQKLIDVQKKQSSRTTDSIGLEKSKMESELAKARKRKKEIYEDYKENLLSREDYLSYKNDYQNREYILQQKINDLVKKQEEAEAQEIFENPWIKKLVGLKFIEKLDREIMADMVDTIYVYESRHIKIVYHFSNELENLFQSRIKINE